MNGSDQLLGIVEGGEFQPLLRSVPSVPVRLTRIPMQAAQTPESAELGLTKYEGQAVMVQGLNAGEWIYSAAVIDQAGPILTAVVRQVFGRLGEANSGPRESPIDVSSEYKGPKAAV